MHATYHRHTANSSTTATIDGMDPRAIITGILGGIALIGAIVLAALERDATIIGALIAAGGTFGGYAAGLYSEPKA